MHGNNVSDKSTARLPPDRLRKTAPPRQKRQSTGRAKLDEPHATERISDLSNHPHKTMCPSSSQRINIIVAT